MSYRTLKSAAANSLAIGLKLGTPMPTNAVAHSRSGTSNDILGRSMSQVPGCQDETQAMDSRAARIERLTSQKEEAIQAEDYDTAKQLKAEIEGLLAPGIDAETGSPDTPELAAGNQSSHSGQDSTQEASASEQATGDQDEDEMEHFDEERSYIFEERLERGRELRTEGNQMFSAGDLDAALLLYRRARFHAEFEEMSYNFELQDEHRLMVDEVLLQMLAVTQPLKNEQVLHPIMLNLAAVYLRQQELGQV